MEKHEFECVICSYTSKNETHYIVHADKMVCIICCYEILERIKEHKIVQ